LNFQIFSSDAFMASWPTMAVLMHEGRDQEILNKAAHHGYKLLHLERDTMVLGR
jgi:hypothetical protein